MIKNVVFDFGQVMVRFEPEYMVSRFVTDSADAALLCSVVFDRLYWEKLDAGTITDGEVIRLCCERLPERLHAAVRDIYYNWVYNIPPIDGMAQLVKLVRDKYGVRVFLLSNISEYFVSHSNEIPELSLFEKCIFSSQCGFVKPSQQIFAHLCKACGILPEETVFVDDNPSNITGAEAYGITGYLFDGDVHKLESYLFDILAEQ